MNVFLAARMKTKDEFFEHYNKSFIHEIYDGKTLLQYAMGNTDINSRYDIANRLIDDGANVNVIDEDNQSLLHILCAHIEHDIKKTSELSKRLITLGVDINKLDNKNRVALQYIINMVKFSDEELKPMYDIWFSQPNVEVNIKNAWGVSPLELAKKFPYRKDLVERMVQVVK